LIAAPVNCAGACAGPRHRSAEAPPARDDAISGFTIRNRRIDGMDILANPERLSQLDLPILD
jgi:hypothetical protein